MLTLITMIIIVRNSPFCSQTVPCNFRQLMTCHGVYFVTYLYLNPRSVTTIQRMVSVSGYIIDYKKRGHQYIAKKVGQTSLAIQGRCKRTVYEHRLIHYIHFSFKLSFADSYSRSSLNGHSRIQLFRERLSEKVHATIPKGIVDGFEFDVPQRNLKELHQRPSTYVCACQRKATKGRFDSYSVWNSVLIISHITFRDRRVHVFADNLSRNNCIANSSTYDPPSQNLVSTSTQTLNFYIPVAGRGHSKGLPENQILALIQSSHKQTPERKSYPPLNVVCMCVFFYIYHVHSQSLFVTVLNYSYISVLELPFFHIHVRLHLKIQTELYALT